MKELTHKEKLERAGIKRFGSKEAWLENQRLSGQKGGLKGTTGGFHYMKLHDPKKFKELSAKGGKGAKNQ